MKTNCFILVFALISSALFGQSNTFSYKTKNGNEIILLSEGQRQGQPNILIGASQKMLDETMPSGSYPSATNAFLVRTKTGENVLIDTGHGRELFNNLKQHGVTPEMIDAVLITHMHGDHIGGLLDENGAKKFPNAFLHLSKPEYDYFNNPATRGSELARAIFNAYGEKLALFEIAQKKTVGINSAITGLPCVGHTPGHVVYLLDDVLIWGDMAHAMAVQMPYPSVAVTFDVDSKQAVKSRLNMLKYIVKNKLKVAGMHIPYPGMGSLVSNGKGGYVFTPMCTSSKGENK